MHPGWLDWADRQPGSIFFFSLFRLFFLSCILFHDNGILMSPNIFRCCFAPDIFLSLQLFLSFRLSLFSFVDFSCSCIPSYNSLPALPAKNKTIVNQDSPPFFLCYNNVYAENFTGVHIQGKNNLSLLIKLVGYLFPFLL